jgi:hypothetical protein
MNLNIDYCFLDSNRAPLLRFYFFRLGHVMNLRSGPLRSCT